MQKEREPIAAHRSSIILSIDSNPKEQLSVINNNISNNNETEEQQFHPISCKNCRQVHKHCDKKLPSCSTCVRRGLTCIYTEPKRKPKKTKKQSLNNEKLEDNLSSVITTKRKDEEETSPSKSTASSSERNQSNRFQPYPSINPQSLSLTTTSNTSLSSFQNRNPQLLSSSFASSYNPSTLYTTIHPTSSSSNNTDNNNNEDLSLKHFLNRMEEAKRNNLQFSYIKQNVELTLASLKKQTHTLYKIVIHPKMPIGIFEQLIYAPISTLEGKALLYAIHANVEQRLGAPMDRQIDLMESTKTLLGLVSHDRRNARVMLAQYFLSFCLLGHGKFKDALFYLNQMNFAVEELKSKSTTTKLEYEENMLVKVNEYANLEITNAIDIDEKDILSVVSFHDFFIKKYSNIFEKMSDHLPPIKTLFPPESFTKENLLIHLEKIDRVTDIINIVMKSHCEDESKRFELDLLYYFLKRTMKILCIKSIDKMEFSLIINLCKEMIEGTNSHLFSILSSQFIGSITISAKEVLRIIKYFQTYDMKGLNNFNVDLFDLLQKHLDVIKRLKSIYKRVEIYYSNLIRDMELILASKSFMELNEIGNKISTKLSTVDYFENSNESIILENSDMFDISEVDSLLKEFVEQ